MLVGDDTLRPAIHKGIPEHFQGTRMHWEHEPPTGKEITSFRSKIMSLREEEAELEAEALV